MLVFFLQVLNVLRPMTHEASMTMVYDERYTPLLKLTNLAIVAHVCRRGTPPFNPAALTALIDRWRSETHSFHLPCGEMTVTLEDIAMILGVKIRGFPVTGDTESEGWQQRVEVIRVHQVWPLAFLVGFGDRVSVMTRRQ